MMRLALAMGRTLAELGATMSSQELTEWSAFEAVDGPIGSQRDDLRSGIVAATLANCHSTRKQFNAHDFMPYYSKPEPTAEESLAALNAAFGGRNG